MIKIFALNQNNKIEFTREELQSLINEAYWDGYNNASSLSNFYTAKTPDKWTITCDSISCDKSNITTTLSNNEINFSKEE